MVLVAGGTGARFRSSRPPTYINDRAVRGAHSEFVPDIARDRGGAFQTNAMLSVLASTVQPERLYHAYSIHNYYGLSHMAGFGEMLETGRFTRHSSNRIETETRVSYAVSTRGDRRKILYLGTPRLLYNSVIHLALLATLMLARGGGSVSPSVDRNISGGNK